MSDVRSPSPLGVRIYLPRFDRPATWPKVKPAPVPFERVREMTKAELLVLGCTWWDGRLMLFPVEWYDVIPVGFVVETINGAKKAFKPGKTDNDTRFGALAFGVPHV